MKKRIIPLIFALLALVITIILIFVNINLSPRQEKQGNEIIIRGTVDYEGIPAPPQFPIHGFNFYLNVDSGERTKVDNIERIVLLASLGSSLSENLEGKHIEIKGNFIDDYQSYKIAMGGPITSADPQGAVILVESVDILS